jgi:NDP-sugar pyrophosphorylase family protein
VLTSPHDYFDVEEYAHRALFDGITHVWEALDALPKYLEQYDWRVLGEVAPGAVLVGSVSIGRGTVVEPGALIVGPTIIGENCEVRHSAYIRGNVVVGNGCVIGHSSELKTSIMMDRSNAPHFNYVGDSINGSDVNLGAGTICANLRLDEGEVFAGNGQPDRERIATGRMKLGAIIGDGVRTACNVVLNPGTLIPRGTRVRAVAHREGARVGSLVSHR